LSSDGLQGLCRLRRLFDASFFGQLGVVSCIAPLIADGGSIVLTSGALARDRGTRSTAHAAIDAAALALADELGPRLRVNVLSPGPADKNMLDPVVAAVRAAALLEFATGVAAGCTTLPRDAGEAVRLLLESGGVAGGVLDVEVGAAELA
jgi:hypothetical protein